MPSNAIESFNRGVINAGGGTAGAYLPDYWRSTARPVAADYGVRSLVRHVGHGHSKGKTASSTASTARVGLCIPCDLADALVGGGGQCDCPQATLFFMRVGAIHAARMHAAKAALNPNRWTRDDWFASWEEEERLFFPLLPEMVASQLIEEHHQFAQELNIYGRIISDTILEQHEAAENTWAEYLVAHMKPAKIQSEIERASVGAGAEVAESANISSDGTFWVMLGALIIIGAGALVASMANPTH